MMKLRRTTRRRLFYVSLCATFLLALWVTWPRNPDTASSIKDQNLPSVETEAPSATPGSDAASTAYRIPGPPPAGAEGSAPSATKAEPVPKVRTYNVVSGDTVEGIASRFGLNPTTILWTNGLTEDSLLQIDQELIIPYTDGIVHTVVESDTMWEVADLYGVEVDAVILANADISPDSLQPGQQLVVPNGAPPRRGIMVASRSGGGEAHRTETAPTPVPSQLVWPLTGELTERFGWRTHPVYGTPNYHEGIDIGVPIGTPIRAVASGQVVFAGWYGGYGLTVRIDHGNGLVSRYSHNSESLVAVGTTVEAGQVIARSGNTGVSTGPHLDFGLYRSGVPIDPLSMLP